jgi:hypothetical protein
MIASPSRPAGTALALLVLSLTVAGCDQTPLTAPTGSLVTLSASATTVPLNGSVELIARVTEAAGTAVNNGTLVTLTTNLGTVDPREARTNNGQVLVRFYAGSQSGTASIVAYSGDAQSDVVEIKVGAAAVSRITLNVTPATVPATGGTVRLEALVSDASGNALAGIPVTFSATAGTLGPNPVVSDTSGIARTTLESNSVSTVTASAGTINSDAVTVAVANPPTVTISAGTGQATVGQPVSFTVSVTQGANAALIRNVSVAFGDGDVVSLGALGASTTVAHVYRTPGIYTATATATDVNGISSSSSTVVAVGTVNLTVSASPSNPQTQTVVTITVTIVPAGVQVLRYDYDFGDGGRASSTGNVTTHVYGTQGQKTITATAVLLDGSTVTGRTEIIVRP